MGRITSLFDNTLKGPKDKPGKAKLNILGNKANIRKENGKRIKGTSLGYIPEERNPKSSKKWKKNPGYTNGY